MQIWMLSQFYTDPSNQQLRPICWSYGNGFVCPEHPADTVNGWALVRMDSTPQQLEGAAQDPRVNIYRTLWDPLTAQTATSYTSQGAVTGMMLGQLLQLLAQTDPGYITDMS